METSPSGSPETFTGPQALVPNLRRAGAGGLGSVPSDAEGDRGLLQTRLALFGRAAALISLSFYLVVNTVVLLGPRGAWSSWWQAPVNRWHLATTALLAALWLLCRGKPRERELLVAIDGAAMLGVGVGFAWMGASVQWRGDPTLPMVLAITHVLGFRAVLVPSTARRTALVHTVALVPIVASAYAIHATHLAGEPSWSAVYDTVYTALWCIVCAVVSTLTSWVIYGLSERVRESRMLGQYTLEQKIGEGGMGAVYRARHAMLRRATAIKLLRPERSSERDLQRFEREVQLTSRLTHPNTIAIYDYGRTPEGVFYYAMEYLDGLDLEVLVQRHGPQAPARVIHLLRQIAGALGEAHQIGLIHRDVKPSNVVLCERGGILDVAKVVDFGLVKAVHSAGQAGLTGTNALAGTPLYMPPEAVLAPERVDARSDLYALGAVGYFLLTGGPVFGGDNVVTVFAEHLHTQPTPPSERLGAPVPPDLEGLVLQCLAKKQEDRPTSAEELSELLSRCADAGGWTQLEARAWWAAHRTAPASVVHTSGAELVSPVTVTVAVHDR
jgi:hypothetical protein